MAEVGKVVEISKTTLVLIPIELSRELPSRAQVFVRGKLNEVEFDAVLEPDGKGGHWFSPKLELLKQAGAKLGDEVTLEITASNDWPEPELPADFAKMLNEDRVAKATYDKATPMAHWEWLRWVNSTMNSDTRAKRIEVSRSKLTKGMRRPCCFNRNMCTVPHVSKNGVLLDSQI